MKKPYTKANVMAKLHEKQCDYSCKVEDATDRNRHTEALVNKLGETVIRELIEEFVKEFE